MQMIDEFNIERLGPLFRCITNTSIEHILQFPKQKLYFKHCTSLIRVKIALHAFSVLKVNDPYHNFSMEACKIDVISWSKFLHRNSQSLEDLHMDFGND